MKIFFANLNPCNTRKVNVRQYVSFVESCNHQIVEKAEDADIIFVWGCEFRADWRDFSYAVVKEIKEANYSAKVVYLGCTFDEKYASKIKTELNVDVIPWKDSKGLFEALLLAGGKRVIDSEVDLAENKIVDNAREFLKEHPLANVSFEDEYVKLSICEGCVNNCSYCSERQMFPAFRSFSEEKLVADCKIAVEASDTRRVMLLGDNTGAYGLDIKSSMPQLIERLKTDAVGGLEIGISQLNPGDFIRSYDQMVKLVEEGTIKYINIPIQSASDKMLLAMRRKYTVSEVEKIFNEFNRLDFKDFSTHLLLGFPGEEKEDVEKSIDFLLKYHPRHVVVSAFMTHPSIEATYFESQISKEEVEQRIKLCEVRLSEAGIRVATDWGSVTKKIMNRIKSSYNLELITEK
jgi:tRNA A37 methylthiotransferase MiaB